MIQDAIARLGAMRSAGGYSPSRSQFIQPNDANPTPTQQLSPMGMALMQLAPMRSFSDWRDRKEQEHQDEMRKRFQTAMQQAFQEAGNKIDKERSKKTDLMESPYGFDPLPAYLTGPWRPETWGGQ